MIEKTYSPADIEARISQRWDEARAFRAGRPERAGAESYCIVIPPPNVTGSLHMGHALNNTLQDVLCRFERLRGKDVLWQPGMDHAGIATQMVVERQLAEKGENRRDLGREEFVARVWKWKAESGGAIQNQLKRLGASCDWSRERFTMDDGLSVAVRKVFVDLYRKGLIYKDKRLVNWDPKFLTAISDLEVMQVEVKGSLWHFKYPIEGEPGRFITVATTRPETMLGDTAVAVHPEDERYKDLVGKHVILPLVGRRIPIVADEYSDPEKGSGAVKITPAHDFNDFEVGRRHGLDAINILTPDARIRDFDTQLSGSSEDALRTKKFHIEDRDNPEIQALNAIPKELRGLDRFEARKRVVSMLEELGLVEKIEPNLHMVPHGDRSNVVIEPYLTDQWYVDAATLAKPALEAVRSDRTRFMPKNWENTYFNWLENIQPWCISRQLWWGHQIPAWYGPDGEVFVHETEEGALKMAEAHYGSSVTLVRDEDVLDTWFSSALWPFSTLGWPEETPELKRFYPTAALVTGFDIIFFWVARMMMMGMEFMGEVPFRDVYIHGIVRDEKGAKMSKSKGNVVDPLDLMDEFGADALRFTMAALATPGRDVKPAKARIEGYRNFATKLWNASRFAEMNGCAPVAGFDPNAVQTTLSKWIAGEAAKAAAEITAAIETYRFDEAASSVYRFVWNVFCDWYLELAKPVFAGPDGAEKDETRAMVSWTLDQILRLLHPFMPFITEELWDVTAGQGGRASVLALADWPQLAGLGSAEAEAEIGWVVDLVTEVRSIRSETNVPAGAQIPLVLVDAGDDIRARVARFDDTLKRLARLSEIAFADAAPAGSIQVIVRGGVVALPLGEVIDLDAERARLAKEIARLDQEVARIDAKLGNESFVARAPEEVVEGEREKRGEYEERKAKLATALAQLQGVA